MSITGSIDVANILKEHRKYFHSGETKSIPFRLLALQKLKKSIIEHEDDLLKALYKDLGKGEFEAYSTEIGFILDSIGSFIRNLRKWAKSKRVKTPVHQFPSKSRVLYEPYGTVLIIGPFNYPFQLLMEPLVGAIAAGNCAVLKPSENTPSVAAVVEKIVEEAFESRYIRVIQGEKDTVSKLVHAPFDYLFFTGSISVGRIVLRAASENLVPVTLELGGKSPVIVDKTANLDIAAKRILWGKLLNSGQTCVAPDYALVHRDIKPLFIEKLKSTVTAFYSKDASVSPDYGRIVNTLQFDRLAAILEKDRDKIIYGGNYNRNTLYIEPTILDNVSWSDAVMLDEIFGPLLPLLEYDNLNDAVEMIRERPRPLALYIFTEDKNVEKLILNNISFGGGCVNDTVSHVAATKLPFGGVGSSGMGAYHGRESFEIFSHHKSILKKSTFFDMNFVYPPYGSKIKLVRKFLK